MTVHWHPANPPQGTQQPPGEANIDRFATLFLPATPPASPTLIELDSPEYVVQPVPRQRRQTQSSTDSDFGAFVSIPPSQDPLSLDASLSQTQSNHTLDYFDRFTSRARTAAERSRKDVLDELLEHQDDPMYFHNTDVTPHPAALPPPPSISFSMSHVVPIPIPMPTSTDEALAEALSSEIHNHGLVRVECGGSVKVAPSPSRSRFPLPPRLSGSASPPSISSQRELSTSPPPVLPSSKSASTSALPSASPPMQTSQPAHATLSRISSSLVSLLPSGRSRAPTVTSSPPSSAPTNHHSRASSAFGSTTLTHGSPFASTPYTPPTGAPGFVGDHAWDRGFSDALEEDEKLGLVDPIGLGIETGTEMMTHIRRGKGKGIALAGRWDGTARVLNEEIADLIRPHLPALTKLPRHWTLLYSLDQHGISLNTLYSQCGPRVPSRGHPDPPKSGLLVVQDAHGAIFGVWLSEGVKIEKGGYYGCGDSFLWRYHPPVDGGRHSRLDVYKWTGANAYVALCEPEFISFGGGDGHYGLYIDSSLLEGSSASCPTFGNPPLCAAAPQRGREQNGLTKARTDVPFECVGLEVWGIGPD